MALAGRAGRAGRAGKAQISIIVRPLTLMSRDDKDDKNGLQAREREVNFGRGGNCYNLIITVPLMLGIHYRTVLTKLQNAHYSKEVTSSFQP